MPKEIPYIGNELELFQHATNWKKYFSSFFKKYVKGNVVEVGAGLGTTTPFIFNDKVSKYICIEPDEKLADEIINKINNQKLSQLCTVHKGVLADSNISLADAIFYIDVIEHIKDDRIELLAATRTLKSGGFLCVLVPANPSDFSPFDKAIGHFRRYNKKMLLHAIPEELNIKWCRYVDSVGSISSKINKLFLKQEYPTKNQILFWDRILIPLSRLIDPLIGYSAGKSLLLVAQKP